jgi:hypothetical protein
VLGDDLVFVQELEEIAVRLKNARPALGLEDLLEPTNDSLDERREANHHCDLKEIIDKPFRHGAALPAARGAAWIFAQREDELASSLWQGFEVRR